MMTLNWKWKWSRAHGINLALVLAGGLALRYGAGLYPVWWLAWLAPAPLLAAVLRSTRPVAWALALLGGLLASSALYPFFVLMMPRLPAAWLTVLAALPLAASLGLARRAMTRSASAWAVLAYPVAMTAIDTLMAHLLLDGNAGSIAYSQAGFPLAVQVVALAGMAGLVFLMSLVPAVLALAATRGWRAARLPVAYTAALVAGSFVFGALRMPAAPSTPGEPVGIAVIDDGIWPDSPADVRERILAQYERHVDALAKQGARIVVLPEKIAMLGVADVDAFARRLGRAAGRNGVWLVAGVGAVDAQGARRNLAWLFAPDGRLAANYQKQHMARPELEFLPGSALALHTIDGTRYGLAICKDMHFAAMGRGYGAAGASAMLVPAWDFNVDGEYAARLSALRGVESGFAMVRGAREGLLTVSDAYGRVVAEARSARFPGTTLLARVPDAGRIGIVYGWTGDLFGWLCVAGALVLAWFPRASAPHARAGVSRPGWWTRHRRGKGRRAASAP